MATLPSSHAAQTAWAEREAHRIAVPDEVRTRAERLRPAERIATTFASGAGHGILLAIDVAKNCNAALPPGVKSGSSPAARTWAAGLIHAIPTPPVAIYSRRGPRAIDPIYRAGIIAGLLTALQALGLRRAA